MIIPIKFLHPEAKLPARANVNDAGYDLKSVEHVTIPRGERRLIKTGISIAIPANYYGRIAPRSGLALKNGIDVMAGVIDSTYRGEIGVILLNTEKPTQDLNSSDGAPFVVKPGDKIAQIIFEACHTASFVESEQLTETQRADLGFGSSGR